MEYNCESAKMKVVLCAFVVVAVALSHGGVCGVPLPGVEESAPPTSTHGSTDSNAISLSSPLTITRTGNVSGWVSQLVLGKALPLGSFGANLSGPEPVEVHINIYDFRLNNKPTKLDPSVSYFSDDDNVDYNSDDESSSEEDSGANTIISELLLDPMPMENDEKLSYGHKGSQSSDEAIAPDLNTMQSNYDFIPLIDDEQPTQDVRPRGKPDVSLDAIVNDPAKLSVQDLDEITELYAGMALCTRIIKYKAVLSEADAAGKTIGSKSGISINTLLYLSKLVKCLSLNNNFNEDVPDADGIMDAMDPRHTPPTLTDDTDNEIQLQILASSSSTEKPTMDESTSGRSLVNNVEFKKFDDPLYIEHAKTDMILDPIASLLVGSTVDDLIAEGLSTLRYKFHFNVSLLTATFEVSIPSVKVHATYNAKGYVDATPFRQETIPSGNFTGCGLGMFEVTNVKLRGSASIHLNSAAAVQLSRLELAEASFDSFDLDLGTSFNIEGEAIDWSRFSKNLKQNFDQDFVDNKNDIEAKLCVVANNILKRFPVSLQKLILAGERSQGPEGEHHKPTKVADGDGSNEEFEDFFDEDSSEYMDDEALGGILVLVMIFFFFSAFMFGMFYDTLLSKKPKHKKPSIWLVSKHTEARDFGQKGDPTPTVLVGMV